VNALIHCIGRSGQFEWGDLPQLGWSKIECTSTIFNDTDSQFVQFAISPQAIQPVGFPLALLSRILTNLNEALLADPQIPQARVGSHGLRHRLDRIIMKMFASLFYDSRIVSERFEFWVKVQEESVATGKRWLHDE
jgi:hypothetical protein